MNPNYNKDTISVPLISAEDNIDGNIQRTQYEADLELAKQLQDEYNIESGEPHHVDDDNYARMLQQYEIEMNSYGEEAQEEQQNNDMEDPIFGTLKLGSRRASPIQMICFSCCPCLVGDICGKERRQKYRDLLKLISFWTFAVNIVMFIITISIGGFVKTSINPMLGPGSATLHDLGARWNPDIICRYHIHRLFLPMILHAGVVHILGNMLILVRFGFMLNKEWGNVKWLVIYIFGGLYGNVLSFLFLNNSLSVGASSSLMGILGAWLMHLYLNWHEGNADDQNRRSFLFIGCLLSISIVVSFSFVPYIDWGAHVGGVIGGMLLMGGMTSPTSRKYMKYVNIISLATYVISVIIMIIVGYQILDVDCTAPFPG